MENITNDIMQILIPAILSIFTVIIGALSNVAIQYIKSKQQAVVEKIGVDTYNANYNIAKGIYFVVEQQVKNGLVALEERAEQFDELLVQKIPYLTVDEIEHFREAVIGEIHAQVKESGILDKAQ